MNKAKRFHITGGVFLCGQDDLTVLFEIFQHKDIIVCDNCKSAVEQPE